MPTKKKPGARPYNLSTWRLERMIENRVKRMRAHAKEMEMRRVKKSEKTRRTMKKLTAPAVIFRVWTADPETGFAIFPSFAVGPDKTLCAVFTFDQPNSMGDPEKLMAASWEAYPTMVTRLRKAIEAVGYKRYRIWKRVRTPDIRKRMFASIQGRYHVFPGHKKPKAEAMNIACTETGRIDGTATNESVESQAKTLSAEAVLMSATAQVLADNLTPQTDGSHAGAEALGTSLPSATPMPEVTAEMQESPAELTLAQIRGLRKDVVSTKEAPGTE